MDPYEKAPPRTTSSVYSFDLGVWRVYKLRGKPLLSSAYTRLSAVSDTAPYFLRMVMEIMHFDPVLTVVYLLAQVWSSLSVAISVYLASRLFYAVERSTGSHEASLETMWLLVARLLWLSLMASVNLIVERSVPTLERRIHSRYEALGMEVRFNQFSNISTQSDKLSSISWGTFSGNVMFLKQLLSMISQVFVLIQTAIDIEDPLFAMLSLIIPTRQILLNAGTWRLHDTPYFVAAQNAAYCRKAAMKMMSKADFRADVLGAGVDSFIVQEYKNASEQCENISDAEPSNQYAARLSRSRALIWALASDFLRDLPMAYCAVCAFYQRKVSLSSIALLHQHSLALDSILGNLGAMFETFEENCLQLKVAYDAAAQSHADADETSYTDFKSTTAQRGRAIQLRNVAFRYPGATALALKNINLTIEPGQLVAVVGKNGSGKSTLMNILTSMLEPTSGELLINSQPSTSYRLRERTAILSQQPRALPLSVSENIGIGMAEDIHNADMIKAAAQKGGVDLSKFDDGRALMLNPCSPLAPCVVLNSAMDESEEELLNEWLKHMDRPVSGGELQRIGVARTFMRLNARDSAGEDPLVDFVVLDEPISATDPQAEKLIIDNFVRERQGRTMMVVTHKFGHLTKAADVIVCMKDGEICELGTHTELLALQGEYASLYKVQAEAYADA